MLGKVFCTFSRTTCHLSEYFINCITSIAKFKGFFFFGTLVIPLQYLVGIGSRNVQSSVLSLLIYFHSQIY